MKYLLFLSFVFVFGCQPNKSEEIKQIKKEALDLHDEVMPKMGTLRKTSKSLMQKADSLIEIDSVKAQILIAASSEISSANESMMIWMRGFEPEFEGTEEERLVYFQKQRDLIEGVKNEMNESLASGKELLGN